MTTRKPCRVEGCLLPKEAPLHSCTFHNLLRQPIEVQVAAAHARLAAVPDDARLSRVPDHLWPPGWRWCAACQSLIPTFYATGSRCRADASEAAHSTMVEKTYGLTGEEYAALFDYQGGRCAICRQRSVDRRLAVDHSHTTGQPLGLLCKRCNKDLKGSAWDSLDLARALVAYMERPPLSGEWKPLDPRSKQPTRKPDRALTDPTYLMHDHDAEAEPLPGVLEAVVKRMTVDQLVFSGGKSDPETGTYWLAYRPAGSEQPPWETTEALPEVDTNGRASAPS